MRSKAKTNYIDLVFNEHYEDFKDFYDENKEKIYKSILEVFKGFTKSKKKFLTLHLSAKIKDLDWDTEFKFSRNETIVLKRDLMPYFEEVEDYETCNEIKNLYKEMSVSLKSEIN